MVVIPWTSATESSRLFDMDHSNHSSIIEQLLRKCKTRMAVLVDRGLTPVERIDGAHPIHILVLFFGGPDGKFLSNVYFVLSYY